LAARRVSKAQNDAKNRGGFRKASVSLTWHSAFAPFLLGGLAAWSEILRLCESPARTCRTEPHGRERVALGPIERYGELGGPLGAIGPVCDSAWTSYPWSDASEGLEAIDEALDKLAAEDPAKAELVKSSSASSPA
jgi:hypothetical protein